VTDLLQAKGCDCFCLLGTSDADPLQGGTEPFEATKM